MRAQGRWAEERGGGEAEGAATADDLSDLSDLSGRRAGHVEEEASW